MVVEDTQYFVGNRKTWQSQSKFEVTLPPRYVTVQSLIESKNNLNPLHTYTEEAAIRRAYVCHTAESMENKGKGADAPIINSDTKER